MTLYTQINKVNHVSDAVQTVFPYNFLVNAEADMHVLVDDVDTASGWSISGLGDPAGGDVTFLVAPLAGTVTLLRYLEYVQDTDYQPYDPFPADTHERNLDDLTMMVQQLQEQNNRTVLLPPSTDGSTNTQLPDWDSQQHLAWHETEKRLVNVSPWTTAAGNPVDTLIMDGNVIAGTGVVDKSSGGFSVARNGTGDFTLTFDTTISTAEYTAHVSIAGATNHGFIRTENEDSAGFDIKTADVLEVAADRNFAVLIAYYLPTYISLALTNGGFETGDLTGWTAEDGLAASKTSRGGTPAYEGSYFFSGEENAGTTVYFSDAVDLVAGGMDTADIDAGRVFVTMIYYQNAAGSGNDDGRGGLRFFTDSSGTVLDSNDHDSYEDPTSWTRREHKVLVPAGVRSLRSVITSKSVSGTFPSAYFDAISLVYEVRV